MQGIKYDELLNCALEMDKIAQNLQELVNQFYVEIEGLQNREIWTGQAAQYYVDESEKLKNDFEQARKQVLGYSNYIKMTVQNYKSIDQKIANSISMKN